MPGNGGVYAVKRRKTPVPKTAKPPPVKTNPSKRHRDRLNIQLDHLTSLLPLAEEVRSRLDKLSVLRLSVGYVKVKSYFHVMLQNRPAPAASANGRSASLDGVSFSEGELLLQALNGFVLVVTADGTVFYASPTIQDFLGFHQSDMVHQSVYDFIHLDDREMFRCQLHFSFNPSENDSRVEAPNGQIVNLLPQHIPPENSSFLERSFCCRLRCLLDNTSGFLAMNFHGRLKYLHMPGNAGADGNPPQLALFAMATPLQPPSVMEIRTKTLIFQTKHRMDFAPVGIDTRGKVVLGYSEVELVTPGSGYQFIHAADMMYCADNHLRMMKTGDSGFTFFRLLTKTGHWLWVQATARVVFKGARPDFIVARQKALTNEEGEEHLLQRRQQLPFHLATGEGILYDTWMDAFSLPDPPGSGALDPPGSGAPDTTEPRAEKTLDPASLLGSLRRQDHSVYIHPPQTPLPPEFPVFPEIEDLDLEPPQSCLEQAFLDSHALLSVPGQTQGSLKRCVTGDLTSEAMMDSLEQILGDMGHRSIEGLEVEEAELRDWENTIVRMTSEREVSSRELNHILANDVFSYVEEALRRETGGLAQDQTGNGSSLREHEQPVTDFHTGFQEQSLMGSGLSGVDCCSAGSRGPLCCNTHQGHTWPPGGCGCHYGNQNVPTQPRGAEQHSRLASVQHNNIPGRFGSEATSQSVQHAQQHTQPAPWQQLPQSFHHHAAPRSSYAPGGSDPTAPPLQPQMQRFSGSCMYEGRDGSIPSAAALPARQSGPLGGPGGPMANPFSPCRPGATRPHDSGPGENYPTESLRSSFFCWNGGAQIPKVPLNGVVDPFVFPALPPRSASLSQNAGLELPPEALMGLTAVLDGDD